MGTIQFPKWVQSILQKPDCWFQQTNSEDVRKSKQETLGQKHMFNVYQQLADFSHL